MGTIRTEFGCINTAFHKDACCNTCWNTHPQHDETKHGMFLGTPLQRDVARKLWIKEAMGNGFTEKQAIFLNKML